MRLAECTELEFIKVVNLTHNSLSIRQLLNDWRNFIWQVQIKFPIKMNISDRMLN